MHIYMTVQGRIIELFLPSMFDQLITKKYLQIKISEELLIIVYSLKIILIK